MNPEHFRTPANLRSLFVSPPAPLRMFLLVSFAATMAAYAQQTASAVPQFEVSTVKPHAPGRGPLDLSCSNGRFHSFGVPLDSVITYAYNLKPYQIPAMPGWTESRDGVYDIEAKAEEEVPEGECRQMVQALLRERFQLLVHRESKPSATFDLVIAKGGPKLRRVSEEDQGPGVSITMNGHLMSVPSDAPREAQVRKGWTMDRLASFLSVFAGRRPVADKTGLDGSYAFTLAFSLPTAGTQAAAPADPDIYWAIQQQLGLKLQEVKGVAEMLIVDHLERPDPN